MIVSIYTGLYQINDFGVAVFLCEIQWLESVLIGDIHVRAAAQEKLDALKLSLSNGEMKRRVAGGILPTQIIAIPSKKSTRREKKQRGRRRKIPNMFHMIKSTM